MSNANKSKFWCYFRKHEDRKSATCTKCLRVISLSGNTTNLKQHLRRHHPNLYLETTKNQNDAVEYVDVTM